MNWFSCLFTGFLIMLKFTLYLSIVLSFLAGSIPITYYYVAYDNNGNKIWLEHIKDNIYMDGDGNRCIVKTKTKTMTLK